MSDVQQLLREDDIAGYLEHRSILRRGEAVTNIALLEGGVSGRVYRVATTERDLVLKQALEQLAVAGDWHADPGRVLVEGRAIGALHVLTPDHTPALMAADPATNTIVMTAAPMDWTSWKERLLTGPTDSDDIAETASTIASLLARWHSAALDDPANRVAFQGRELFETLRLTPFHRCVRTKHPQAAARIDACIDELSAPGVALVHGDLSPKNILLAPDAPNRLWVIDFEVAHVGHPVFDLAFLTSHLVLKEIHRPALRARLRRARADVLATYRAEVSRDIGDAAVASLGAQTACLLLARVDGTSPATYLTPDEQQQTRRLALDILTSSDPENTFAEWSSRKDAA